MSGSAQPSLYIIAGPNGAGKTTAARVLLPTVLNCEEFINADEIARGISPLNPESVALQAGRLMLQRIDDLLLHGKSFAFETTLASRMFAKLVLHAKRSGYTTHLLFFWLPTADVAVERVRRRVAYGGHNIPEPIIRRRYAAGLKNLILDYMPIMDAWTVYDNTSEPTPTLIAEHKNATTTVYQHDLWHTLKA